jgi:hypothetical protein
MTAKAKTKTDKKPRQEKQEKSGTYKQKQLDRELADSFRRAIRPP